MRPDFDRVIIERPRRNSGARSRKWGGRVGMDYEFEPRARSRFQDKDLTDLLGPLRRYLRANVGRPWDKVHSEIRAVADARSLRGYHLLDHVKWEVETRCVMDGKRPVVAGYGGYRPVRGFWVHPRSGLLRHAR
jgi:hypothetical protein